MTKDEARGEKPLVFLKDCNTATLQHFGNENDNVFEELPKNGKVY